MTLGVVEYIQDYIGYNPNTGDFNLVDLIKFSVDLLLVIVISIMALTFIIKHTKSKGLILATIGYVTIYMLVSILGLKMMMTFMSLGIIMYIGMLIVNFAPEIKNQFIGLKKIKSEKSFITDEQAKEELIDTLLKTVSYLTSRKIGAIITIEKENSLNTYIEKATQIESLVTYELLSTIFFPNTALHDGAVIIRGNRIICAGAFYPSSEKADIPKQYGSRHRAGIGISEVTDAFTIILSEETGKIATTIGGTITGDTSIDSLKVSLEQNIIVK